MDKAFKKFSSKVKNRLRRLGIILESQDHNFLEFLFAQFGSNKEHPQKTPPIFVTRSFVRDATAEFLKISVDKLKFLLKKEHTPKKSAREMTFSMLKKLLKSHHHPTHRTRLIWMVGRRSEPKFKITTPSGVPLTPQKKASIKQILKDFDCSFSPLDRIVPPGRIPRERASNKRGETFERDISLGDLAIWRGMTPQKGTAGEISASPYRLECQKSVPSSPGSRNLRRTLFFSPSKPKKNLIKRFEFTVTRESLESRLHMQRPTSQKQVMGGYSATEVFRAAGYIIDKKLKRAHHWAHRQGWMFGGAQQRDNLDPTTAGSNYDTLFKVEAPIAELLLERKYDSVKINGTVEFKPGSPAPFRITYLIDCGHGKPIEVVIDPLSHRIPTVAEFELARRLYAPDDPLPTAATSKRSH